MPTNDASNLFIVSSNVEDCVVVVFNSLYVYLNKLITLPIQMDFISLSGTFDWFQKLILYLDSVWFDYIYKK